MEDKDVTAFEEGVYARIDEASFDAFPDAYLARITALGTRVPNDRGIQWQNGWLSVPRVSDAKEVEAANRLTNLGQFRSRHRRER